MVAMVGSAWIADNSASCKSDSIAFLPGTGSVNWTVVEVPFHSFSPNQSVLENGEINKFRGGSGF